MATGARDASLDLRVREVKGGTRWPAWVQWLKHALGLDKAIAYTVLARVTQIVGSTGTVLLILRFLTPVEQGYYYTLLSLVYIQAVFELGSSFVILQMAAHESVHLKFRADGRIEGDPVAHARLASVLQKTFLWYLLAAVMLALTLLPIGVYFFNRHAQTGPSVAWQGPWAAAVFATALLFLLNTFFAFLEGCGQIWQVGRMRFGQAVLGAALSWGGLLAHHGLYSPSLLNLGYSAAGLIFLYKQRKLWLGLLRYSARDNAVSWRNEIWPFQWKIGVSWIGLNFSIQILTPVLFAYRGPAEAGRVGMSLSVVGYLWSLALAWMSTKATPFGQMIARGEFNRLDHLFFRTLRQSLVLLVVAAGVCEIGLIGVARLFPLVATRLVSPSVFLLFLLTALASFIVQAFAVYLRAHKNEPFVLQSTLVAVATIVGIMLCAKPWGEFGAGLTYFLCTGVLGLLMATVIFRAKRSQWKRCPST